MREKREGCRRALPCSVIKGGGGGATAAAGPVPVSPAVPGRGAGAGAPRCPASGEKQEMLEQIRNEPRDEQSHPGREQPAAPGAQPCLSL